MTAELPAHMVAKPILRRLFAKTPRRGLALIAALLAALALAPLVLDRYVTSIFILIFWSVYVGQAWNIMMGYAGLLSLGHALYVGLGAYIAAALFVDLGIGPWLGVFPAVAAAMLVAAFIGWLGFRFRIEGVYFALLTIAFAEVARIAFDNLAPTGGAAGLFLPVGEATAHQWWNLRGGPLFFYYLALALAALACLASALIRRSRLGHYWLAVREDPQAAAALGINVTRARMSAVLVSSGMTAVAGVFYAFYYNNLFPSQIFDISRSIDIILGPIIGGIGTLFGPVVGAFLLVPLGEGLIFLTQSLGLNAPGTKAVFYGICLMVIITLAPNGLWPALKAWLKIAEDEP